MEVAIKIVQRAINRKNDEKSELELAPEIRQIKKIIRK